MNSNAKKSMAVILAVMMIFMSVSFLASAVEEKDEMDISNFMKSELDLSQYTMDDLRNMSADELCQFVRDFERVYDPFGSYCPDSELQTSSTSFADINRDVASPQWKSGNADKFLENSKTHEWITSVACSVLMTDKGFFSNKAGDMLVYTLEIILGSIQPDNKKDSEHVAGNANHFYDPDTGLGLNALSTNNAKVAAVKYYNEAVTAAKNKDMTRMCDRLGRCLHFIQDINVPHHAANLATLTHADFESRAEKIAEDVIGPIKTISITKYTIATSNSIPSMFDTAAKASKAKLSDAMLVTRMNDTAKVCLKESLYYSVMFMYKFSTNSGVPFYAK